MCQSNLGITFEHKFNTTVPVLVLVDFATVRQEMSLFVLTSRRFGWLKKNVYSRYRKDALYLRFLYEGRYLEDGVEEFVIAAPDTGLLGLAVDVQYPEEDT
jgi:hypothetical protein